MQGHCQRCCSRIHQRRRRARIACAEHQLLRQRASAQIAKLHRPHQITSERMRTNGSISEQQLAAASAARFFSTSVYVSRQGGHHHTNSAARACRLSRSSRATCRCRGRASSAQTCSASSAHSRARCCSCCSATPPAASRCAASMSPAPSSLQAEPPSRRELNMSCGVHACWPCIVRCGKRWPWWLRNRRPSWWLRAKDERGAEPLFVFWRMVGAGTQAVV